jgi:hypothetical protein
VKSLLFAETRSWFNVPHRSFAMKQPFVPFKVSAMFFREIQPVTNSTRRFSYGIVTNNRSIIVVQASRLFGTTASETLAPQC